MTTLTALCQPYTFVPAIAAITQAATPTERAWAIDAALRDEHVRRMVPFCARLRAWRAAALAARRAA